MRIKILPFIGMLLVPVVACDDLEDKPALPAGETTWITDDGTAEMYVLSEGLFNLNNSTLARYSFETNTCTADYFRALNRRGLGDTANDMDIYGGRLYIVVNVSSTVEVVDLQTGLSVGQVSLLAEDGSSRQPRAIAFDGSKAYVCSYDGTVARMDTASLQVEALTQVGRNPEDICVQDGKLYVSNSGGLDWEGIGVDRTVSVIDLQTFKETKRIEVGPNPGKIAAGRNHTVWVATYGEAIEEGDYHLVKINAQSDAVEAVFDEPVMDFAIDYDIAYLYNYDYRSDASSFKVFDLASGTVVREQFITDGTPVERPYAIAVNPYSSNVYITEAYNYQVEGDVLCFTPDGKLKFRVNGIGLNPNTVLFRDVSADTGGTDMPDDPDAPSAFANRVWEYVPAPSQYMNTITVAYRDGFTQEDVLNLASERLRNRSLLSLGAYGGYIVVGFSQPVPNVEGDYDLKIYGNANYNPNAWQDRPGGSAEPGIVLVAKDVNGNGLPDDPWYELAGSEYGKDTEMRDYEITYYRPQPEDADVRWTDNQGNEGYVYRNEYHTQASYYPAWVETDCMVFSGKRLKDNAVEENGVWVGYAYDWGYVDNHPNGEGTLSQFKIEWAVDAEGNPVHLDEIDFVKVYTAVNQYAGRVGELSTEIAGIENLHFDTNN